MIQTQPDVEQVAQPLQQRNFRIPGASVIVQTEEEPMAIEALLAIVFQMAGSNPDCKVHFYIKVEA